MLRRLFVKDFIIVDELELEFDGGFGALTGETGAGKSILVDALSLALGERGDASLLRQGATKAEVVAEFAPTPELIDWLQANDFDEDGCLLRRIIDAAGRSRASINGSPATLGQLRQAADFLADIHGQHAYHALLRPEAQRQLLDAQAGTLELVAETAGRFRTWRDLRAAREAAERDAESLGREREMLEWQVRELDKLAFDGGRWLEDNLEHRRLAHSASLLEGTATALLQLDEAEVAATVLLDDALSRLRALGDFDPALLQPVALLDAARIQIDEAVHELSRYRDRLDPEPERLAELEARLDAVTSAARKYRVAVDELPALLDQSRRRLADLTVAADPAALAAREAEARAAYDEVAGRLSERRQEAATALAAAVTEGMQQLAMPGGRFSIRIGALTEPASHGRDDIAFLVAANPGQEPRPLAKVASGGELSRIGLAIQVIASCAGQAPTVIFDEVDVGIGGGVAEVVGRLLQQLGRQRQVLCVTHLPQVAARADWQWSIAKETTAGQTTSRVTALAGESRVEELARMLGGLQITETTRQHAREMLTG